MKKLALAAASLALAPALISTSAFATSPGQLNGGSNLYGVRNVTKNVPANSYSQSITATCGDDVKYSISISNSQYETLSNVTVKAPLTGVISESATNTANQTVTSNGTVTVTLDKGTLTYVAGSTKLYTESGTLIKALDDGITTTGINAGELKGSTIEYVQFHAKVDCPTTTTPTTPTTPVSTTTPVAPLPSTGAGDTILPALGLAAAGAAIVYAARTRRSHRV